VKDVVETTEARIKKAGVKSADDVRLQPKALVQHSPERRELNLELRDYLYKNLYYNPVVHGPNLRAVKMLDDLFKYYLKNPHQMGGQSRNRIRKEGRHRAICDYLAGMTDRYAMQEHARIFGPTP
jgi:dGTPase